MEYQIIEVCCDMCGKKLGTKKVPVNPVPDIYIAHTPHRPHARTLCKSCQKKMAKVQ